MPQEQEPERLDTRVDEDRAGTAPPSDHHAPVGDERPADTDPQTVERSWAEEDNVYGESPLLHSSRSENEDASGEAPRE